MKTSASDRLRAVRRAGTGPEQLVRDALTGAGLKPVFNSASIVGTPDVVLSERKLAIFVHGCFWHSHSGCSRATVPKTNRDFWVKKFADNVSRDRRTAARLRRDGWHVWTVWECQVSKHHREGRLSNLLSKISHLPVYEPSGKDGL